MNLIKYALCYLSFGILSSEILSPKDYDHSKKLFIIPDHLTVEQLQLPDRTKAEDIVNVITYSQLKAAYRKAKRSHNYFGFGHIYPDFSKYFNNFKPTAKCYERSLNITTNPIDLSVNNKIIFREFFNNNGQHMSSR